MRMFAVAGVVAVAAAVVAPADAKTVRIAKTAKAGASTKIDHYTGWNDDCSFLSINVDVVDKPAHGTVTPRVAQDRIREARIGKAGSCLGKPTRVIEVHYRPTAGFKGSDTFAVRMKTPKSTPVTFVYSVSVR